MSKRIQRSFAAQTRTETVTIAPKRSECDFFVNTYLGSDGNIFNGARNYRNEANARKAQAENGQGPGVRYLGVQKFTVKHP